MKFILWMLFMLNTFGLSKCYIQLLRIQLLKLKFIFFFGEEMSAFDAQSCCL